MKTGRRLLTLLLFALALGIGAGSLSVMAASGKNGIVKENGVTHYYKNGKLVKNTYGVKYKGTYYTIDAKGTAKKVSSEVKGLAYVRLTELGITPKKAQKSASSKKSCLKKAFQWCYEDWAFNGKSKSSVRQSAIYGLTNRQGNCKVQAATFYYLAKALGYKNVTFVKKGYIINSSTGNYNSHAWVTIKVNGKTRVFDPNFAYVYQNPKGAQYAYRDTVKNGFWMKYGASGTYQYYTKKNGKYKLCS